MSKYREFTRQEFYDLVWATPMLKLAKQFGLSDVGLRKNLRSLPDTDTTPWLLGELQFGKPVRRIPLAPPGAGVSDRAHRLRVRP